MNSKNIFFYLILLSIIYFPNCREKGENIETIGKDTITTSDFETYYETYIEKTSRLANAEKQTLYKLMCHPEEIPQEPAIQELIAGLYPENAYQKFREMKIIEQAAKLENFDKKVQIKNILEQVRLETLINLYIQEKIQERMKISSEQIEKKCESLRNQDKRVQNLPIEQCLKIAEAYIKNEFISKEYPKILSEIKESIQVVKNNQFDKDKYLKNDITLYKEARKIGQCVEGGNGPEKEPKENSQSEIKQ